MHEVILYGIIVGLSIIIYLGSRSKSNDRSRNSKRIDAKLREAREELEKQGRILKSERGQLELERDQLKREREQFNEEVELAGRDRDLLEELQRRHREGNKG